MQNAAKERAEKTVDEFVKRVTTGIVKGKRNVRKAVTERADAWKESLEQMAQNYHEHELELISVKRRLDEALAERTHP